MEKCFDEEWSVLSIFGCCGPFPRDLAQVFAQIILYLIKNCQSMFYNWVPNGFYCTLVSRSTGKGA